MPTIPKAAATPWGAAWWATFDTTTQASTWKKGAQYAEEGAVTTLVLTKEGQLHATVQDIGGRCYEQQLQCLSFTAEEQRVWVRRLVASPQWVAQLLNHQLPTPLLANAVLPALFPVETVAWNGACSCRHRVWPCRHLVAVLYALRTQIDQNPLVLFQLRGLPLLERLQQAGANLPLRLEATFPTLKDWCAPHGAARPYDLADLSAIDYSNIDNRWSTFSRLLEAQPLFFEGNLTTQLRQLLQKAARWQAQQTYDHAEYRPWHQRLQQARDLALVLDADHQLVNVFAIEEEGSIPLFASDQATARLVGLLETVEIAQLPRYPDVWVGLHAVYCFALKLLQEQAVLPHLIAGSSGWVAQWLPAYNVHSAVQCTLTALAKACPSDMLLLDAQPLQRLSPHRQIQALVHLWVSFFVRQANERHRVACTGKNKLLYLFSNGEPMQYDGPQEKSIPQQLRHWLQPFYLTQEQYAPVLCVVEQKEEEQYWLVIEIRVENRAAHQAPLMELQQFLHRDDLTEFHISVLQALERLSQYYPDLKALFLQQQAHTLPYTVAEFERIFFEVLPMVQSLGISVLLPAALQRLTRPRLGWSITAKDGASAKGKSFMNLKKLLQLEWKVAVGSEMMEAVEFLKLMKQHRGLVRYKDRYLYLNEADLKRILEQLHAPPPATATQIIHAALSKQHEDCPVVVASEAEALLQQLQEERPIPPPQTLRATLRSYQQVGYAWMYKNAQLGLGSLIADDMGLGKTLQVIALLLKFKEEGTLNHQQVLVVVPTSLLTNWKKEIAKFAPSLTTGVYHGPRRQMPEETDVILTTYGVARMEVNRFNQLHLYALVIDEAQAIKNVYAGQTEAIKAIKATLNIAMSGTPVENRLTEYWSIMDFVHPQYLGSITDFKERFSQPIENDHDQATLKTFRSITAPFILRRLKSDASIIEDLPDKIEQDWVAHLQPVQRELYQQIVDDSIHALKKYKIKPKERQTILLQLMGALKQICNHPYQYLGSGGSGPVHSGKSQVLMDLLTRINHQGEKVLLFTQYRKMGRLFCRWIEERFGQAPLYLHGSCSRTQRDNLVEAFQNDRQKRIFVLSLKAAGTGLNLTAANHVIHYDLWWNPAVEAQATDRAYRIGQQKNVQVYRLLTEGTIEERINTMIQSKKQLADQTVVLGEQWLGRLSDAELEALVRL